jgi:hypothetical protein
MGKVSDSELRSLGENPREVYNFSAKDYNSENTDLNTLENKSELLDFKNYNSRRSGLSIFPSSKLFVSREELYESENNYRIGERPLEEEIQEGLVSEEDMSREEEYRSLVEEEEEIIVEEEIIEGNDYISEF